METFQDIPGYGGLKAVMAAVVIAGSGLAFAGADSSKTVRVLEVQLGSHMSGEKVARSVMLRNDTGAAYTIVGTKSSCGGCVVAKPASRVVPSGGEIPIAIEVDGQGIEGELHKTVLIYTDSKSTKTVIIDITGKFEVKDKGLRAYPDSVNVNPPPPGRAARRPEG